jgi:hypothetical protein
MPTKITYSVPQIAPRSRASRLSPLMIAAVTLTMLHLIGGIMLVHSQAAPVTEISALAALNDDVKCSTEMETQERTLPFD